MYNLTLLINENNSDGIGCSLEGDNLEKLKGDIAGCISTACKEANITGEASVELTITKDGEFFDHDEFNVLVSDNHEVTLIDE